MSAPIVDASNPHFRLSAFAKQRDVGILAGASTICLYTRFRFFAAIRRQRSWRYLRARRRLAPTTDFVHFWRFHRGGFGILAGASTICLYTRFRFFAAIRRRRSWRYLRARRRLAPTTNRVYFMIPQHGDSPPPDPTRGPKGLTGESPPRPYDDPCHHSLTSPVIRSPPPLRHSSTKLSKRSSDSCPLMMLKKASCSSPSSETPARVIVRVGTVVK